MKIIKLYLVLVMVIALCCGCGRTGVSQEKYDAVIAERDMLLERIASLESELENANAEAEDVQEESKPVTEEQSTVSSSEDAKSDVEIVAEYTLPDGIGWYTRHFLVIKNNSNETVDVSTSSLAYSKDKTMVGADDASLEALGAGCVSLVYEAFDTEATIDYYETELSVSPCKYYESVIQDLSYVQNDIKDGAVFQVTNNGKEAAKFVEGYALFFMGEELVGYESTYFTDDDSEIKPGKTVSKQMTTYEDFDRIEFYLTGRK